MASSDAFQKKITLPGNIRSSDAVISGKLLTFVKHKGFLINHYSTVAMRRVVLLRNGLLIVYKKEKKGWVMALKRIDTLKIKRMCVSTKQNSNVRTQVEFKSEKGSITMVIVGDFGDRWVNALTGLNKEEEEEKQTVEMESPVEGKVSSISLFDEAGVISDSPTVHIEEEVEEEEEKPTDGSRSITYSVISPSPKKEVVKPKETIQPKEIIIQPKESIQSKGGLVKEIAVKKPVATIRPEKTVRVMSNWRRPPVSQLLTTTTSTTESIETASIRHGEHSVATLRNLLEAKAQNSLRKTRSLKSAVPTAVLIAEKKKIFEETASLRAPGISLSAPATLMEEMKKNFPNESHA